jgi:uncharacterized RmlC-like cupin family protein
LRAHLEIPMTSLTQPSCVVIRPEATYPGKQGLNYTAAVSAETVGAKALCMHLLTMPPGARANAHKHAGHETALYVLSGAAGMWYGDRLEQHVEVKAGEFLYIPAGVPHLPYNLSASEPCTAVLSRTDPNEQESVVLTPELERAVPPRPTD